MTKQHPSRWARAHARSLVDPITVATRRGGGGLGPSVADPVTVLGHASAARTLTIGEDGEEAAGTLVLRLPPTVTPVDGDDELDALGLFALGSEVTALGHTGHVVRVTAASYRGVVERVDVTTD